MTDCSALARPGLEQARGSRGCFLPRVMGRWRDGNIFSWCFVFDIYLKNYLGNYDFFLQGSPFFFVFLPQQLKAMGSLPPHRL